MSSKPWYPRFSGDFSAKTKDLSMTEVGAYDRLLDHYYIKRKPLPADMGKLMRVAGAEKPFEREAVQAVIAEFFYLKSDGYHNDRADEELSRQLKMQARGKAGADARWGANRDATGDAYGMPDASEKDGISQPQSQPQATTTFTPTPTPTKENSSPGVRKRTPRRANGSGVTVKTWEAYASAYGDRYGTPPVRNATVNGQLAQLVGRLGAEEAPAIAAFYVTHNKAFYVSKKHPVGLLLQDAEGLHTEWATGRQVTETEARHTDRTAATGATFGRLISEAKA